MSDTIPQDTPQSKKCAGPCQQERPLTEFYSGNTRRKDGTMYTAYHSWCKTCDKIKSKSKYISRSQLSPEELQKRRNKEKQRDKTKRRNSRLKERFGINLTQYEAMHKQQNGVCAICGQPETHKRKGKLLPLSVDHDHKTSKVRGLLCGDCNKALGRFEKGYDLYNKYLSRYQ